MKRICLVFSSLVFIFACVRSNLSQESPSQSAEEILNACQQTLEKMNYSSMDVEVNLRPIYRKWPKSEQREVETNYQFLVARSIECLKIDGQVSITYDGTTNSNAFEHIINRDSSARLEKSQETGDYTGAAVSKNLKEERKFCSEGYAYAFWLDGFVGATDCYNVIEYLLNENNMTISGTEKIDEFDCTVITSQTDYGTFTLWMDMASGSLFRKVECKKGKTDKGKPCSDDAYTEVLITLDNIAIEKIENSYVITQGRMSWEGTQPDGRIGGESYNAKRSHISLNPSFERDTFAINIPRESDIINLDNTESGVTYIWDGKKAVPGYTTLNDSAHSASSMNMMRMILIIAGLAIISFGVFLKLRKRYQ